MKDPDGRWSGFYTGVIAFACNTERLAELGTVCPTSWEALSDPVLEGELIMPSPAASGTAYTALTAVLELYGEDEGFAYLKKIDPNFGQYTDSSGAVAPLVARGEYAVGLLFAHDIEVQRDLGLPLEVSFPAEGTAFEVGGVSILNGSRNPAAAQAWTDYLFSTQFQRYHNDVAHRIPVVPGVDVADGNVSLDDVVLLEGYDPSTWAARRDELTERWVQEIGSLR
jgi:iron(III) transport system substrate-binding protein